MTYPRNIRGRVARVIGLGGRVYRDGVTSMTESSDRELLDLIRRRGPLTVVEMGASLGVTGTAIRNRLARLLGSGLVERRTEHGGRGRPKHAYQASVEAQKRLGQNYADLAFVLWEEMMSTVEDRKLRRLLFTRITDRLADVYRGQVSGQEWEGRLVQLCHLLHDRGVEAEVTRDGGSAFPILRQHSCPVLRARRGRPRHLRPRAQDVRESAGARPAHQPVPARRRPLLRLPGQAFRRR